MYAYLLAVLLTTSPPVAPDTLVVCPPEFRQALGPWLVHRAAQGHRIEVVPNAFSADELRAVIGNRAALGRLRHVLLVGDADPAAQWDERLWRVSTPTFHVPATVTPLWGSDPYIATDNVYADLNGDGLPELAVGRLTADSADELSLMVRKILRYEQAHGIGKWQRQINLVAGVGGFGPLVDAVIESATQQLLTEAVPPTYEMTMTYGSWQSPYCPDPRQFRDVAIERLNDGCLFWIYIGHGHPTRLDSIRVPGQSFPSISTADASRLASSQGSPIALLLACHTGAFDADEDSLAEEMLRSPGGPVAVVAGSRVTMPYAMSVMASEMIDAYFQERPETLGELLRDVKRRAAGAEQRAGAERSAFSRRQVIDLVGRLLSPAPGLLEEEILEHVQLFNLLGDPLLRLPHPRPIELEAPAVARAGEPLTVRYLAERPGRAVVELVARRDEPKHALTPRARWDLDRLDEFTATYERANDRRWWAETIVGHEGSVVVELDVPPEARGHGHVRLFLEDDQGFAMGSADLWIEPLPAGSVSSGIGR